MTKIIVIGAKGRMGQRIIARLKENPALKLAGEVDLGDSLEKVLGSADVFIDFSSAETTVSNLQTAAKLGKAAVIGTTGHSPAQKKEIEALSKKIPIVMAPNMSVGVNVLWKIIADAARLLGADYDVGIVETHHTQKKDSPSGTALKAAEVLKKQTSKEIQIQAFRGGDVVGDHTVTFWGNGERLEITHQATSRDTFALGALRAAQWIVGKPNGLYSMADVLGI